MRRLPDGAWDGHAHVIGDPARFPLAPGRTYEPPFAPLEDYLDLLDRIGAASGVLVQPSVYGFDNRCMLDALARAEGRLLGVAVPPPDATTSDLEALHRGGVRGVRCNLLNLGGLDVDTAVRWQPTLRALGWHVDLQIAVAMQMGAGIDADRQAETSARPEHGALRALLERFEVPVVIDHMGRPAPGDADPHAPALRALIELVREGRCFVKLSAPYRLSAEPPPWRDVAPLAHALLDANADGCLWGSDWPHTDTRSEVRDEDLLAALWEWCPNDERLGRVVAGADTRLAYDAVRDRGRSGRPG